MNERKGEGNQRHQCYQLGLLFVQRKEGEKFLAGVAWKALRKNLGDMQGEHVRNLPGRRGARRGG